MVDFGSFVVPQKDRSSAKASVEVALQNFLVEEDSKEKNIIETLNLGKLPATEGDYEEWGTNFPEANLPIDDVATSENAQLQLISEENVAKKVNSTIPRKWFENPPKSDPLKSEEIPKSFKNEETAGAGKYRAHPRQNVQHPIDLSDMQGFPELSALKSPGALVAEKKPSKGRKKKNKAIPLEKAITPTQAQETVLDVARDSIKEKEEKPKTTLLNFSMLFKDVKIESKPYDLEASRDKFQGRRKRPPSVLTA